MERYKIIKSEEKNIARQHKDVVLHEDIFEILFKYKKIICNKFDDIRGTLLIDHLSINIINPNNKIVIFSTTPSVEYNLLTHNLWKHDQGFSISHQINNRFYSWDTAYKKEYFNELKLTKQLKHGFTFGFNLSKMINEFQFIYSFATRHPNSELMDYYRQYINELFSIGNYIYKPMANIHEQLAGTPILVSKNESPLIFSPFLRLISNNK